MEVNQVVEKKMNVGNGFALSVRGHQRTRRWTRSRTGVQDRRRERPHTVGAVTCRWLITDLRDTAHSQCCREFDRTAPS